MKQVPWLDGWGRPYRVISTTSVYTITSYGSDGVPDGPDVPRPAPNGGTTDFRNDLVFSTGSFIQFPDGTMT